MKIIFNHLNNFKMKKNNIFKIKMIMNKMFFIKLFYYLIYIYIFL